MENNIETTNAKTTNIELKKPTKAEAIRQLLNDQRHYLLPLLNGTEEEKNNNYNKLVTNFCFSLIENDLQDCTKKSMVAAFKQCCDTNLNPSNGLGKIYLIKYKDKQSNENVVAQVGYAGYIDLVMRSEKISHVYSNTVYEGDEFSVNFNNKTLYNHKRNFKTKKLLMTYAVAVFKNGDIQIEIADIEDIEMSKKLSKSAYKSNSPWQMHYNSMAEVVAMRRLMKPLGLSLNITNEFLNTIDDKDISSFKNPALERIKRIKWRE